ncbi:hypothetical protein B0H15DRAFT_845322 [Mycena belliarum]|uniref:Uncharacterized protein n=1 Tax=Mycena belliarum TaxID=1033014 RepID=A0AAD6U0W6_9AGAR|nr:hypothetical protein B0H15DRAFT_845322 [Mycena belliae]
MRRGDSFSRRDFRTTAILISAASSLLKACCQSMSMFPPTPEGLNIMVSVWHLPSLAHHRFQSCTPSRSVILWLSVNSRCIQSCNYFNTQTNLQIARRELSLRSKQSGNRAPDVKPPLSACSTSTAMRSSPLSWWTQDATGRWSAYTRASVVDVGRAGTSAPCST